ncbi:MAG TPA: 3-dehydroquinate synthase [bacterium]|nr:3-dehydroquinate synthase [bacterium]
MSAAAPPLSIRSRLHDYTVRFHAGLEFVGELSRVPNALFVVDANVARLHAKPLAAFSREQTLTLEATEENKTFEGATRVYEALLDRAAKKNATIVSLGGGIVQDVTGFAASTLYRGVKWIFVPTTLLAQADSCIGAKTSLNFRRYKNLLGTFYPPHEIHLSPAFLDTLTRDDFFSGLGEVVKLHLMGGDARVAELTAALPALRAREPDATLRAIRTSLDVKLSWIEGDELDAGKRNLLNYGHDLGHALESTSEFKVPHGQAVVAGMLFANSLARRRGVLSPALEERLRPLLLGTLVTRPTRAHLETPRIVDAMGKDKKRTGKGLAVILLRDGLALEKIDDATPDEVGAAIGDLVTNLELT